MMGIMAHKYEYVYPRSLQVGDTVLIGNTPLEIVRINANRIRVTVYFFVQWGAKDVERGYTYWVEVGEIRAKKVALTSTSGDESQRG